MGRPSRMQNVMNVSGPVTYGEIAVFKFDVITVRRKVIFHVFARLIREVCPMFPKIILLPPSRKVLEILISPAGLK